MPNGQSRSRLLKVACSGQTIYWGVKTVDTGFMASTESSEQTAVINADCTVTASSGGSSSSTVSGGGGKGWWLYYDDPVPIPLEYGRIVGQAFVDINGNGKREQSERGGFAGMVVKAVGIDARQNVVVKTGTVNGMGEFAITVPVGTYKLTVEDPRKALAGMKATLPVMAEEVVVEADQKISVGFAWRSEKLVNYQPCLEIGEVETTGKTLSEALLESLTDPYGVKVTKGVERLGTLMTRKQFLMLLARMQCREIKRNGVVLRDSLKEKKVKEFADLGVPEGMVNDDWTYLAYSLLADGLPVGRVSGQKTVIDANAPVTRREAMAIVAALLPDRESEMTVLLPADATESDASNGVFRRVFVAGVLPRSFESVITGGITWGEGSDLLMRVAFVTGKIPLGMKPKEQIWYQDTEVEYLSGLGTIAQRPCLVQDPARAEAIRFTGVLPSDPEYMAARLRFLASMGVYDKSFDRMRWLITGRPSEYGVNAGYLPVNIVKPVTRLELLQALLVVTCHPLENFKRANARLSGEGVDIGGGTADAIFAPDRYSATKDDTSFVSRVFHSAQRPIREFNLSPFAFTPDLVRGEEVKDFNGAVSRTEASKLLASAGLYSRVMAGAMSRTEAEEKYEEVQTSILEWLTGIQEGEVWRKGHIGNTQEFTWDMLVVVLSDLLGPEVGPDGLAALPVNDAWAKVVVGW